MCACILQRDITKKEVTSILETIFHSLSEELVVCLSPSKHKPHNPSLKGLLCMMLLFTGKKNIQEKFWLHQLEMESPRI